MPVFALAFAFEIRRLVARWTVDHADLEAAIGGYLENEENALRADMYDEALRSGDHPSSAASAHLA